MLPFSGLHPSLRTQVPHLRAVLNRIAPNLPSMLISVRLRNHHCSCNATVRTEYMHTRYPVYLPPEFIGRVGVPKDGRKRKKGQSRQYPAPIAYQASIISHSEMISMWDNQTASLPSEIPGTLQGNNERRNRLHQSRHDSRGLQQRESNSGSEND